MNDFVVVGGGVIGMLTALELADGGAAVTLVERGQCGREASWAGGGIVSPLYPWRYSAPISRLSAWSEGFYPTLAERLIETTGIDPEYRQQGLLYLNVEDAEQALAWSREYAKPLTRVDADFVYDKAPAVAPGCESALWMPTLGSIRNPRLGKSLRAALDAHPRVRLLENVAVQGILLQDDTAIGVQTANSVLSAGQVVVCGGAWSREILSEAGLALPVRPVRGQMVLFKAPKGLVERVVLKNGRYVIPRGDGRIVAGSTLEEVGFDKATTAEARESLIKSACEIIPALAECEVEHHWAGLRPGSPTGTPFIGAVPERRHLHVNAGHYRNGLVLAPASTRLLADQLLGRTPIIDPAPYQPETLLAEIAALDTSSDAGETRWA